MMEDESQKNAKRKMEVESQNDAERKMERIRRFSRLFINLSKLCKELDQLLSAFMLICFLVAYLLIVHYSARLQFVKDSSNTQKLSQILKEFVTAIVFLPNFVEQTQKSSSKIVSAMFSLNTFDDPKTKIEMNAFCLRYMYYKPSFSAFGMFKINRALTFNLIQSMVPYAVIFYKIVNKIQ